MREAITCQFLAAVSPERRLVVRAGATHTDALHVAHEYLQVLLFHNV